MTIAKVGGAFQVNTSAYGGLDAPAITSLDGGGFVVTWQAYNYDSSEYDLGIWAQMFDADGNKLGGEFHVNSYIDSNQQTPTITGLAGGGFVVSWFSEYYYSGSDYDYYGAIVAQVFDASGTVVGNEFLVNAVTNNYQSEPSITALAGGGFVVTWTDSYSGQLGDPDYAIAAQVFDADGNRIGDEFRVNGSTAGLQIEPAVTGLANGNFVVTWSDYQGDFWGEGIKARIFSSTGAPLGAEFIVNTQQIYDQGAPSITSLADGGFVVSWTDAVGDANGSGMKAQIFSADGTKVGSEILVNTVQKGEQSQSSVTGLADGSFVVAWTDGSNARSYDNYYGSLGIKAQVFNADGTKQGGEFLINPAPSDSYLDTDQTLPAITALPDGGFVVSWLNGENPPYGTPGTIQAQIYGSGPLRISSDGGGDTAALSAAENKTAVTTVNADYVPVGATVTYAIFGGADADKFTIDAHTGVLTFKEKPDFEVPGDAGSDGVYDVTVSATDGTVTDTQAIAVTVTDAKEPPSPIQALGDELVVPTLISANQTDSEVARLANGGFVVTWMDMSGTFGDYFGTSIKAQVFGADGAKQGNEFLVNTSVEGSQITPSVTGLEDGRFVVTWGDRYYDGSAGKYVSLFRAQIFDAAGGKLGNEFAVSTGTYWGQRDGKVTALADGGFVFTWVDESPTGSAADLIIKAQVFGADGAKSGGEFQVHTSTDGFQFMPEVTGLADGGFVVTWLSRVYNPAIGYIDTITAQIFDAAGAKVGGELNVNGANKRGDYPTITGLAGGGFVITWIDYDFSPGGTNSAEIRAQIYTANGTKAGSELVVNTETLGEQWFPKVAGLPGGGFVVTWFDGGAGLDGPDDSNIKAQVFDANGVKQGDEFLVNSQTADQQYDPDIAGFGNGGFVVTWTDNNPAGDGSEASVKAQIYGVTGGATNAAPVINSNGGEASAALSIAENTTAVTTVHANDADAGTTLVYSLSGTDAALFDIDAGTGVLSFKTAPNFEDAADAGEDNVYDVVVTASDGALSDTQALAITVTGVNEAPTAPETASVTTSEDAASTATAIGAADPDGDTLSYAVKNGAGPARGSVGFSGGAFVYTPDANANGSDSFTIVISDGKGGTSEQVVSVTVDAVNDAPALTGSKASLANGTEDTSYTVTKAQLLQGYGDVDGDTLAVGTLSVDQGTASENPDGSWTVSLPANYNGALALSYTVVDGNGGSVAASLAATINAVNDSPALTGKKASLANGTEDTSYTVTKAQLLQGYGDVDGDTLSVESLSVDQGTASQNPDGSWTVSLPANYNGALALSYTVVDGSGGSVAASLAATINAVNDAPTLTGSKASLANGTEDTSYTVTKAQLLQGYGDVDGDTLSVESLSVDQGTASQNRDGSWTVSLPANYNGALALSYTVVDGKGGSVVASLAATINAVNDAPVIDSNLGGANAAVAIAENTTAVTTVHAADPDAGAALVYSVSGADASLFTIDAATGALTFKTAPDFEAPGDAGFNNVYNVIVTASDGTLSDTQALAITVTDVGDAPTYNTITGTALLDKLTGTSGADEILGLAGNDTLRGLAGSDLLDGGSGNDLMLGGLGDDIYVVDAKGDRVSEKTGEGTDTVQTTLAKYTLGKTVENLTFTDSAAHSGTGNALANHLTGGAGADELDGLTGADILEGGLGGDTYYVDNAGDSVIEASGGGADRVFAAVSFALAAGEEVEAVTLKTAKAALALTGSNTANVLTGNSNANTLSGLGGNDTLIGGTGNDTLTGGTGADTFVFNAKLNTKSNIDTVTDFVSGTDKLALDQTVFKVFASTGAISAGAFWSGAGVSAAHDADDRLIYNTTTGALLYDADGIGTGKAVQIAVLAGHPDLAFGDILIVA